MFLYVLIFCGFLCGYEGTTFMYTYFIEMFYFQQSISAKYIIVYAMHASQNFDTKTYSILRLIISPDLMLFVFSLFFGKIGC